MSFRRMLPFILINIFVSTAVVLSILFWWDNRQSGEQTDLAVVSDQTAPLATSTLGATNGQTEPQSQFTSTPEPTEAPPLHVVQPGETLGSISEFYDVTLDDIMTVNGLTNPNIISVGEQLIIPINGLPEPTAVPAEATQDPNVIPTPIDTQPPPENGEFIVEISQVTGVGELAAEAIQIRNVGSSSVALLDWKVADQDGFFYTFSQLTLFGDGAGIILHTNSGQNSATEVYWGLETAVWDSGELVTLLNADGAIVDTFEIP